MDSKPFDEHTPVLALHCSLASSAQWRSLARAMPEREVIAVDLLGYGDAPPPARGQDFSLDQELDAIERQLAKRLGAEQPLHVVGHSYGGAVAWRFALRDPSRVKSIALFEPVTMWLVQHDPEAEPFHAFARTISRRVELGLTIGAAERFVDFWSGAGTFSSLPPERQSALAEQMGKVKLDFAACLSDRTALPVRGHLQMPALLMNGSDTFDLMRANIRILRRAFSECATAEVPGGHMAPVEDRGRIDALIANFIRMTERQMAGAKLLIA